MDSSIAQSPQSDVSPRRPRLAPSCDRCHTIKERCVWQPNTLKCQRCLRLHHTCQIKRSFGRPGRKARSKCRTVSPRAIKPAHGGSDLPPDVIHASGSTEVPSQAGAQLASGSLYLTFIGGSSLTGTFDIAEQQLIDFVFRDNTFLEHYLLVPSFRDVQKQAIVSRLNYSAPLLKDALFACVGFFSRDHQEVLELTGFSDDFWIRKAAKAVSSLRSIKIAGRQDISAILFLGATTVTFAPYLEGSNVQSICRYILQLVSPSCQALSQSRLDSDDSSFLTCLVYTETVCCLFSGEVPTLRLAQQTNGFSVDRYLGLSRPLLTLMYDICRVNRSMKSLCHQEKETRRPTLLQELEVIENKLHWSQPECLGELGAQLTPSEVLHIIQQFHLLRLAALLILHRLRFAYDDASGASKGLAISKAVLSQLEVTTEATQRSVICSEFAFVVACFELQDEHDRKETLDRLCNIIGYQTNDQQALRDVILSFWLARKRHVGLLWSGLSDALPRSLRWP